MKYQSKYNYFYSWKWIWKCCLENDGHFVGGFLSHLVTQSLDPLVAAVVTMVSGAGRHTPPHLTDMHGHTPPSMRGWGLIQFVRENFYMRHQKLSMLMHVICMRNRLGSNHPTPSIWSTLTHWRLSKKDNILENNKDQTLNSSLNYGVVLLHGIIVNMHSGNGFFDADIKAITWTNNDLSSILTLGVNISLSVGFLTPNHNLTHWYRVTHIYVNKLTIIGSDDGLSPGRRQAIIWTNAGILLIRPLGTNFSEILIKIYTFSFKKIHLKMSSWNGGHFVSASMS